MRILSSMFLLLTGAAAVFSEPIFNIDYAAFRSGDIALLGVYTMIQRNSLEFQPEDAAFSADFSILVEIRREDNLMASSIYDHTDRVSALNQLSPTQKIPDEALFLIQPGRFTAAVTVFDSVSNSRQRREMNVIVRDFGCDSLMISDIEFATSVRQVEGGGRFVKRNLLVVPYADRIFGSDLEQVSYYAEFYNLTPGSEKAEYIVERFIFDENDRVVKKFAEVRKPQMAGSVLQADSFSIAELNTGSYYFQLRLTDGRSGKRAVSGKSFWALKPGSDFASIDVPAAPHRLFDEMSDELILKELEYIVYLAGAKESKRIKKLNATGGRLFLRDFWQRKQQEGINRDVYLFRIQAANERYGYRQKEGWRTDRGRVLILNGEPNYTERVFWGENDYTGSFIDIKSMAEGMGDTHTWQNYNLEVWYYKKIEGGVAFAFVEEQYTGDYRQVYSSKGGEFSDNRWLEVFEQRNPAWFKR